MCRIAGIWQRGQQPVVLSSRIRQMTEAMRRGGPDDEGFYMDNERGLALGHRRLSLIDLSTAGHQPMADADGQLQLVFNGEIYNFRELKRELESLGHVFNSHSDTEVILKAYGQWKEQCFARFNGMFALALYDHSRAQLLLARDHAGIKPLYYSFHNGNFYFSSEIRGFRALSSEMWEEDKRWPVYLLVFGHIPEPFTTLQGVQALEKGHYMALSLDSGKCTTCPFHRFQYTATIRNEREAVDAIRTILPQAVERHLIADAPIGLFLSGGIDSSLLTLLAQPYLGDHLRTLSIYFSEEKFSEKPYQEIIIRQTGAHHQSFLVTEQDFSNALPDVLEAMDLPTMDGINSYFISRYAHQYGLKAVLSGLGADELFGGYPSFRHVRRFRQLKKLPSWLLLQFKHAGTDKWRKIAYAGWDHPLGEYLLYRGLHDVDHAASILECSPAAVLDALLALPAGEPDGMGWYNHVSWLESNWYMQNQLLKDTDFMSMWHSLEVRVPFLDKELMQLAWSTEEHLKFNRSYGKYLLIEAFRDVLPEAIWNRPKQGFTFPFAEWMKQTELVQPQTVKEEKLYKQYLGGKLSWSRYWAAILVHRRQAAAPSLAA